MTPIIMNTLLEMPSDEKLPPFSSLDVNQTKRILVVDDDESIRQLILSVLTHSGYEVDEAENGTRAWEALQVKCYDLLITDNNMPEMTGLQLVEKLRSSGFELPVALASGGLPSDLLEQNSRLRLAAVIPKPFTLDELVRTISTLLTGAAANFNCISEHLSGAQGMRSLRSG